MASPITSVPDPAEGGASTSADPLAGVITQVSPKQAAAPSRGGPARPTKVAKQGTAKATDAEKKRKKQQAAVSGQEGIVSREGGSEAKVSDKLEGSESAPLATATETEGSASHSQNPSSTLVGTTTTQPSTLTTSESGEGLTKDKPVDAKATPTEPAPTTNDSQRPTTTASQQDMTGAAQRLSTAPALSQPKGASGKEKIELAEKGQSAKVQNNSTSSNGKKQRKRPGLMAKIIAALTCSSAAAAIVEEEEDSTKKGTVSSQKGMNGRAGKVDSRKPAKGKVTPTPQSIGMERNTSSTATSPGGGTRLPREETGDVMSGAVVPPGSSFVPQDGDQKRGTSVLLGVGGSGTAALGGVAATQKVDDEAEEGDEEDEWTSEEQMHEDEDQTEEQRLIRQGGVGIPKDEHGNLLPLLAPLEMEINGRKCLVLDLDETLVHSSFKIISNADFIVPVEIEGTVHNVYVIKRPGVDEFMRQMGEIYEVVVFTASLAKYADPVLDILDIHGVVRHRLFRESCYNHRGNYVKDLSQLGREIHTSIIIDNSPASYIFHPNNAVPISSWFNDPHDTELTDLCPFLAELADVDDVRAVLDGGL